MNCVEGTGNGRGTEAYVSSKGGATRGAGRMDDPHRNKGTAFTPEERRHGASVVIETTAEPRVPLAAETKFLLEGDLT